MDLTSLRAHAGGRSAGRQHARDANDRRRRIRVAMFRAAVIPAPAVREPDPRRLTR